MFHFLARLTATHPWKVCAFWVVAAIALASVAPSWDTRSQDDDIRFLPARTDSVRGYQLLQKAFPNDVFASRLILAVQRLDAPLTDADLALVDQVVGDVQHLKEAEPELQIGRVYSHRDPFIGKRLLSADRQCALVQISLGTPYLGLKTRATVDRIDHEVRPRFTALGVQAPRLLVTGPAGFGRDLITASASCLDKTTLATVLLVIVVLLLVYRAPLLALVPLVTIGLSTWVALQLLALATLIPGVYLVNVSQMFAIVLLYGAGTDYCIFLISRYREELAAGHSTATGIDRSVVAVGAALAASAATVICGLGLMGLAEFAKVRCAGPAIALSLLVVLAASLTLTPALLHILGRRAFWPQHATASRRHTTSPWAWLWMQQGWTEDLWDRVSRFVVARPLMVFGISVAILTPLAVLGMHVKPSYRTTGELAHSTGSVQGLTAIQKHFVEGEVGPVTFLLSSPQDWASPQGRDVLHHLSRVVSRLENVAEVRSLTQPLGSPMPNTPLNTELPAKSTLIGSFLHSLRQSADVAREQVDRSVREFYLATLPGDEGEEARSVTRVDVVLGSDPFAPQSAATLNMIETWLRERLPKRMPGVEVECHGVTVNARDLADVTEADRTRVNCSVLLAVFLILVYLVWRPHTTHDRPSRPAVSLGHALVTASYLLVTVLFSYYATLGATSIVGTAFCGRELGELDWRVPFFLFTILVAVGEDYNILLMARALAERERAGAEEGVRRALASTGGAITSCGVIMAGTFATLMLAGLNTLVQMGFALAFGVLLDTFVVRPFLVPSVTLLLWRREDGAAAEKESVLLQLKRPYKRRAAA